MFKLEKLPKDVYEKVESIDFFDEWEREETGNMSIVFLEEGFVFEFDESTVSGFENRKDLIELVRCQVVEAR
jgi:hypothetical protein